MSFVVEWKITVWYDSVFGFKSIFKRGSRTTLSGDFPDAKFTGANANDEAKAASSIYVYSRARSEVLLSDAYSDRA